MKYVIYNNYQGDRKYITEIDVLRWTPDWLSAMHFETLHEAQRSRNIVQNVYIHSSQMQLVIGLSYVGVINAVEELQEM